MEAETLGKVLKSKMRRKLVREMSERPLDVSSALSLLNSGTEEEKYRQTVYRCLEDIKESGMAEKYYDSGSLKYRLKCQTVEIDLKSMRITGE